MSKFIWFIPVVVVIFLLIDWYVFSGIRSIFINQNRSRKKLIFSLYWGLSIYCIIAFFLFQFFADTSLSRTTSAILSGSFFVVFFTKLFISLFLLVADTKKLVSWVLGYGSTPERIEGKKITRSQFLVKSGMIAGAIPFASMGFGILSGAYDYRIIHQKISLSSLPKAFHGLKIVQISDIHSGSFYNQKAVLGGIEMALREKPDVIFFTGDLVNNRSSEMEDYVELFEKLQAPMGVFSILGNHDYGNYSHWKSDLAKRQNMEDMYAIHKQMNWRLLRNESAILETGTENLGIIGVENWGKSSWMPKLGDMKKALEGTEDVGCKILLSHDPSHWDHEVNTKYHDIELTLSGHTHGMQFGVEVGGIKWSPVKYLYPRWAGLYQEGNQQLYVNRGFGFLAFPGRIGMPPEITVLELVSS